MGGSWLGSCVAIYAMFIPELRGLPVAGSMSAPVAFVLKGGWDAMGREPLVSLGAIPPPAEGMGAGPFPRMMGTED